MRLPDVLDGYYLPPAELSALRLDGVVYPIGDGYRPVDYPEDRLARAASLRRTLDGGRIAHRETAAWVHGALPDPPRPMPFCVAAGRSKGIDPRHGLVLSEAILHDDEVLDLAGVLVTSALRTAVDLLRAPEFPAAHERAVHVLMSDARLAAGDIRERLSDRRFQRERTRARTRLAELAPGSQPAETRYTS